NAVALRVWWSWRVDHDGVGGCPGRLGPVPVLGSLEVVVGHLAFDDAGLAAQSAWWQEVCQQVVAEVGQRGDQVLRGKRSLVKR
ncbi:hypothetical protein, partial [Streptomyces sp. KR55]|uniref:hypothetical protein n=1 Tax=Streptomyces sp. KR55 TaxID=3457425 RepID=UPI003FD5AC5C